jgi:hypothetical protein
MAVETNQYADLAGYSGGRGGGGIQKDRVEDNGLNAPSSILSAAVRDISFL